MRIETLEQNQLNQLIEVRSKTPDSCESPKVGSQRLLKARNTLPLQENQIGHLNLLKNRLRIDGDYQIGIGQVAIVDANGNNVISNLETPVTIK